ncbi:hypothetical protein WJ968_18920 [Achromobacter xylosoxidans]
MTYGGPVGGTDIQSAYLPPHPGLYGSVIAVGALGEKFYDNDGRSPTTSVRLPGGIAEFGLLYVYPGQLLAARWAVPWPPATAGAASRSTASTRASRA